MVNVPPLMSSAPSFLLRARSARSADLAGEGAQALAVGVVHDRHDEAFEVEVDGDAEVHVVVQDQFVVADRRVDVRELADRIDDRAGDERDVA